MKDKKCLCGRVFNPKLPSQKFHSPKCFKESRKLYQRLWHRAKALRSS